MEYARRGAVILTGNAPDGCRGSGPTVEAFHPSLGVEGRQVRTTPIHLNLIAAEASGQANDDASTLETPKTDAKSAENFSPASRPFVITRGREKRAQGHACRRRGESSDDGLRCTGRAGVAVGAFADASRSGDIGLQLQVRWGLANRMRSGDNLVIPFVIRRPVLVRLSRIGRNHAYTHGLA